jgi:bifunctional UDP-N-acetylglucosamine pyrophosphorylase/glucosamine-1-phosphate N-acetyltransferase
MKQLDDLIQRLKKEIDSGNEFNFSSYLDEFENLLEGENPKTKKSVSWKKIKNASVNGSLTAGKGTEILPGTVIEGAVVIGNDCKIGPNAYLRGVVYIGNNCHVGISEVKNSIILDNSNVPHFNYVGDSIIGENVNLGAGTKVANLRHDNKSIKISINGRKIDSRRRKLGALIGSGTKTGINSSINCGVFVKNNSKIMPNEFVK